MSVLKSQIAHQEKALAYQPLARKYRPGSFAELVGQESVAQALANGIRMQREPHAVIFSGVRGIGKTTIARLYARALNCAQGPTPEPCNECPSCMAITAGTHEDVLEIDGASNTGVDDVRALRETVSYAPQRSKFKVYVIDEVHMLSQSAFNALLKTLEEPPNHVVFVFATTELHKIPATIISRCQSFYLRKISVQQIAARLEEILQAEGVAYEKDCLIALAREGRGSMRDAITLLDQAVAIGAGQVDHNSIRTFSLSHKAGALYLDLLDQIVGRRPDLAFETIAALDQFGSDFAQVAESLAVYVRHAIVLKTIDLSKAKQAVSGLETGEIDRLIKLGENVAPTVLNQLFRHLARCRIELDGSELDRFVVENHVFEWCLAAPVQSVAVAATPVGSDSLQDHGRSGSLEPPKVEPVISRHAQQAKDPAQPAQAALTEDDVNRNKEPVERNFLKNFRDRMQQPDPRITQPVDVLAATEPASLDAPAEPMASQTKPEPDPIPAAIAASVTVASPPAIAPISAVTEPECRTTDPRSWPPTWHDLVEIWKQTKPLQARILEEAYDLEYSPTRISLAARPESMAGQRLLQHGVSEKIRLQLVELFGFAGQLSVSEYRSAGFGSQSSSQPAPESLLDTKRRQNFERREKLVEQAHNHPITQTFLEQFSGKIESVITKD